MDHFQSQVRENAGIICEKFMEKYIYNMVDLENSKEEDSHDENTINHSENTTARSQMRGFELIMKIFDSITV